MTEPSNAAIIGRFYDFSDDRAMAYACDVADHFPRAALTVCQEVDGTWTVVTH